MKVDKAVNESDQAKKAKEIHQKNYTPEILQWRQPIQFGPKLMPFSFLFLELREL